MTLLDQLYTQSPGAVATPAAASAPQPPAVQPAQAQAASAAPAPGAVAQQAGGMLASAANANATGYNAHTQAVPNANLTGSRLNTITSQDSPLMQRARQEGVLMAAKRGLQNSSIAAGTAQGAMVDRAAPIAMQEADHLQTQSLANQAALNRAAEVSTGRETDVSVQNAQLGTQTSQFNAGQQNDISQTNAQLGTQTSQFNAGQQNEIARLNAQLQTATSQGNAQEANSIRLRLAELQTQVGMQGADINARANELTAQSENQMRTAVLQQNAELNRQYLAGAQEMDLEQIRGRHEQLIQTNRDAASLYNNYFATIANIMANPNMLPERAAQVVQLQQQALDAGLRLISAMSPTPAAPGASATPVAPPPAVGVAPPAAVAAAPDARTLADARAAAEQTGNGYSYTYQP